jgi:hypothetical protein
MQTRSVRNRPGALSGLQAGDGTCHCAAFLDTAPACLRTFLAMRHGVFCTFLAAGIANIRAEFARCGRELAATRHVGSSKPADLGAIHVEGNTFRHCADIRFLQAKRRASIAGVGTCLAGFDTRLKLRLKTLRLGHDRSSTVGKWPLDAETRSLVRPSSAFP